MTDTGMKAVKIGSQSFIVNIKCAQNHTWQGNLTWVEQKKTLAFRSVLEMIKLIDSAIEIAMPKSETEEAW